MAIYSLDGHVPVFTKRSSNWIAPDASLTGKIRLEENVSIWFGAVLRGDNELIDIRRDTNIQEHCVLHTDMGYPLKIGAGCTIGHRAMLHGCEIGENSLIGIGAILLNGVKIGKNSLVGAGALVTEGKEFPDNSLIIGSPARAIRQLDAGQINGLRESAQSYVENGRRFILGLELQIESAV